MKEIIKVERFIDAINKAWSPIYLGESKAHNIELWSDFGDYPDLIDFEAEVLTLKDDIVESKKDFIYNKCVELIQIYENEILKHGIKKGVSVSGSMEIITRTVEVAENKKSANINMEINFKDKSNSKYKQLKFTNSDIIDTLKKICSIVRPHKVLKRDLSKFDDMFVITIGKKQKDRFKIDIDIFVDGYTNNQIVALASVLYGILHNTIKPKYFITWLELFCAIIDKETPTAKQSKDEVQAEIPKMKQTYYYLFDKIP